MGETGVAAGETAEINFTSFGVRMRLVVPAALDERARTILPPDAVVTVPDAAPPASSADPFAADTGPATVMLAEHDGRLEVSGQGLPVGATEDEDLAFGMVDAQVRATVALLAPDHIFVHAGVVAVDDRAVVLPGRTHTGKTTLVSALVRAGATYYSDEFAVVGGDGRVLPYAKPLSIRRADRPDRAAETPAAALGGRTGTAPVPITMILLTAYRPGGALAVEPLSGGEALLGLLSNAIPARTRPEQTMATLGAAVRPARGWRGDRGDADAAALRILKMLRPSAAP